MLEAQRKALVAQVYHCEQGLAMTRADLIGVIADLHPYVFDDKTQTVNPQQLPDATYRALEEMHDYLDAALRSLDYAELAWRKFEATLDPQQDLFGSRIPAQPPPRATHGRQPQRVLLIGGLSDDQPNPEVLL